jgi:hypothetical protein
MSVYDSTQGRCRWQSPGWVGQEEVVLICLRMPSVKSKDRLKKEKRERRVS